MSSPNSSEHERGQESHDAGAAVNGNHLKYSRESAPHSPSRNATEIDLYNGRATPLPGFDIDIQFRDLDASVENPAHEHPASPLNQAEPQAQREMSESEVQPATTKSGLPTWDVIPTIPEPPTLHLTTAPTLTSLVSPSPVLPSPIQADVPDSVPTPPSLVPPSPIQADVPDLVPTPPPPSPLEKVIPSPSQVDYVFEDIPRLADARSIHDALRTVIMTRLLRDQQTRDERVAPILMENLSVAAPPEEYTTTKTQHQLIEEVSTQRLHHSTDDPFLAAKSWLYARFDRRRTALIAKKERLQLEYQTIHKRWRRHCASLNEQAKPVESDNNVPVSGRTTRRSAASLGDTVRSDLEMEQIIASLGYDEATDPTQLSSRNLAVIPDMISVTGRTQYAFDDTNHLVENPSEYYAPCTGIHDWTEPEKELFLDKYAAFPKQFGLIADFLPNKTTSQCVDYYYLHKKKLIDFRRVVSQFAPNKRRRRGTGKQKGNGLLSDIRQHDAEVNRDSDDSPSFAGRPTRGRRVTSEARKPSVRRNAFHLEGTTTGTPTPEPEARPKRRRAAVTNRSVLFQDDLDDDTDGEPKKKKRGRKPKSAAIVVDELVTPLPTPPLELDVDPIEPAPDQWSNEDKALFQELLAQHGENFKRIAVAMPNKTTVQVAEYAKTAILEAFAAVQARVAEISGQRSQNGMAAVSVASTLASAATSQETSPASVPASVVVNAPAVNGTGAGESGAIIPGTAHSAVDAPQNDEVSHIAPALDPSAIWDSMDPGSALQTPPDSPGPDTKSSDPFTPDEPVPAPVVESTPAMASLSRETSISETRLAISTETTALDQSPLHSLKVPEYRSSIAQPPVLAGPSSVVPASPRVVADMGGQPPGKDAVPPPTSSDLKYHPPLPAPVMSSLNFDPTWGYYDPDGLNRATFNQPNHYPDSRPPRPPSPRQPVPYATPPHPPTRPPAGAVAPLTQHPYVSVPYPYYIPPPYPSTSYHPYGSYKS